MDIQKLFEAFSEAGRESRKPYHLSLGKLRDLCAEHPAALVQTDCGCGLGREHSYRGYYDDPAFEPSAGPTAAADVLAACDRALSNVYEGYKGGDYRYGRDAPLWFARYGDCGAAITGAAIIDGNIILSTKDEE